MLMKISMPILSTGNRISYEKEKNNKIKADRGGKKLD